MTRASIRASLLVVAGLTLSACTTMDDDIGPLDEPTGLDSSSRKDVNEVTTASTPSGPATPVHFCNPSAPTCP